MRPYSYGLICLSAALAAVLLPAGTAAALDREPPDAARETERALAIAAEKIERAEAAVAARSVPVEPRPLTPRAEADDDAEPQIELPVPDEVEVEIDCDAGQSVNRALIRTLAARKVVLRLSGTCRESVQVARPGVTLTGTAAGGATIHPPAGAGEAPALPAVQAVGAHGLTLEGLTLTGGTDGLQAHASRQVRVAHVRTVHNESFGVYLNGTEAVVEDSDLSSNATPLLAYLGSLADVRDSTLNDNTLDGPWAFEHSTLNIRDSEILDNPFGPQAFFHSRVSVGRSSIRETQGLSGAFDYSRALFSNNPLHDGAFPLAFNYSSLEIGVGPVAANLILVLDSSALRLVGVTVTGSVQILDGSRAEMFEASSAPMRIEGDVFLSTFSDALISTANALPGRVLCRERSRVEINTRPVGGVQGCE